MNAIYIDGDEFYDIPNCKGYKASKSGKIASFRRKQPKILKPATDSDGYHVVSVHNGKERKTTKVHRLVMQTFTGESLLYVNHKDFNRQNNRLENLEYATPQENRDWSKHRMPCMAGSENMKSKLDWAKVLTIHTVSAKMGLIETARHFGISDSAVSLIRKGKNWASIYQTISLNNEA